MVAVAVEKHTSREQLQHGVALASQLFVTDGELLRLVGTRRLGASKQVLADSVELCGNEILQGNVFIDEHRDEFGVEPICTTPQVTPSTYCAAKRHELAHTDEHGGVGLATPTNLTLQELPAVPPNKRGCVGGSPQSLAACTRRPATVSTLWSPLARTTTTLAGFSKQSATLLYPSRC